jgi:anti-sigma factor RsiW
MKPTEHPSGSCESFQDLIEMRLHGALDADASAQLDAHLATCAACQTHAAAGADTLATMRGEAAERTRRVDWDKVAREVARRKREYSRTLLVTPVMVVVTTAAAVALIVLGVFPRAVFVAYAAVLLGMVAWQLTRAHGRLIGAARAARGQVDLVADVRAELDRRIARMTRLRVIFPLLAGLLAYRISTRLGPGGSWGAYGVQLFACVLMVAEGFYFHVALLPQLRRERAALR